MRRKQSKPKRYVSKKTKQARYKRMAATIKKVVLKTAETKLGYFNIGDATITTFPTTVGAPATCQLLSYNLMYQTVMTNGTGGDDGNFVGDQVYLRGVRVRLMMRTDPGVSSQKSFVTMMIVAHPKYYTLTSIDRGDCMPTFGLYQYPPRMDNSKCKVLFRKQYTFTPQINGIASSRVIMEYIPLKRSVRFDEGTGQFALKGYNYYLVFTGMNEACDGTAGKRNVAGIRGTVEVLYKDP